MGVSPPSVLGTDPGSWHLAVGEYVHEFLLEGDFVDVSERHQANAVHSCRTCHRRVALNEVSHNSHRLVIDSHSVIER